MASVLSFYNQKGGVAKTTSTVNVAVGLANKGKRVLVIDIDAQCNTTKMLLNTEEKFDLQQMNEVINSFSNNSDQDPFKLLSNTFLNSDEKMSIADVLKTPHCIEKVIQKTVYKNLDIVPSSLMLGEVDDELNSRKMLPRHKLLKLAIDIIKDKYDFVIIDCPPAVNICTLNVILASDMVFIPIKISREAVEGFLKTVEALNTLEANYDQKIEWRALLTMVNRNKVDSTFENLIKCLFPNNVIKQTIRTQNKAVCAASFNKKILIDDDTVNVGVDYKNFVEELL